MSKREDRLEAYRELLRIPSISAKKTGIQEAASYLKKLLEEKGVKAKIMKTDGHPVVYGEYSIGAPRTLLVYNHYDVQPVDPESEWQDDPFSAKIKAGRVYARGSSDNKGTLMARLFGIEDAINSKSLHVNLKFLYEGEEEIGSPNLHSYIMKNKPLLKSDAVIMEGSTVGDEGRPVISLGVKGLLYIQMDEETAGSDLHSSLAAVVPNPVWNLVTALNSIYDGKKVLIPDFYKDVRKTTASETKLLSEFPYDEEEMKKSYTVKYLKFKGKKQLVNELYTSPTCNIDGIHSGYTGEGSKTVTPRKAMLKLDFRLVPNQDPKKILENLKKLLRKNKLSMQVSDFGLEYPVRTSPDSKLAKAMIASAQTTYGKKPIVMINSPGTQPMALFTREVGIKEGVSAIGVGDHASRAHAPNESVPVDNFYRAIDHTKEFLKLFK